MKKVLNVGGGNKIPLPHQYEGWIQISLDINQLLNPDICDDARELLKFPADKYDSVYCSHNLEHYYPHDARRVLAGFVNVLKPDGFALICVPDMDEVFKIVAADDDIDIESVAYESPMGPITFRDMIYGHAGEIERSGNEFYAHKTGFTEWSLISILKECGFRVVFTYTGNFEIIALAFYNKPAEYVSELFGLGEMQ